MAKYNLLVLPMVLLACSTIPAHISGLSTDATMVRSDEDMSEMALAPGPSGAGVIILRSYNGCSYNQKPHDLNSIFCCDRDGLCWGSLQECMPNCPCTNNCSKKKVTPSLETNMTPLVQD